jgi:ubiquitin-conjugating enzyme E2 variant
MIVMQIVVTVLLADLVSGTVHWLEDAYARPGMHWINKIAEENLLHHARPREFLKKTWWQSSWDLMLAVIAVIAVAWIFDVLTWQVWLFSFLVANANQIHKWAHSSHAERGVVIRALQHVYLLQTPRHHARHHSGEKNTHYCVITNFLNPILEEVEFWKRLERINHALFGLERRTELAVFNQPGRGSVPFL